MLKNRFIRFLALISIPFIIMILVNTFTNQHTDELLTNQCSRYCHNNGCPHVKEKLEKHKEAHPVLVKAHHIYQKNIALLHNNGMGMTYQEANLFIYVLLAPGIMILLLWGALRKQK